MRPTTVGKITSSYTFCRLDSPVPCFKAAKAGVAATSLPVLTHTSYKAVALGTRDV
jgi:hypothetical protein